MANTSVVQQDDSSRSSIGEGDLHSSFAKEDRAVMWKVDKRFLPLIGMMVIIKNIDQSNAALAKVLQVGRPHNIMKELHMTPDQYNWVGSMYFISYILFEIPSSLLLKKITPRHFQSRIILTWGIVLACHSAVRNASSLYAIRFLLGALEAGLFPAIIVQLASWYRTDEMGKPVMWVVSFANMSGIVGSLIAYGVSYLNGVGGLSAWRWLYLLEGLATICFTIVVFIFLPDYPKSPRSQKWLTPREQDYLEKRLSKNAPLTSDSAFTKEEIIAGLKDIKVWSFTLQHFLLNLSANALSWQLPTVVTSLGFAGLPRNLLLNIPPAAGSVLLVIFSGWFLKQAYMPRPLYAVIIVAGALAFFTALACHIPKAGIYIACVFGTSFYSAYSIPLWAWRSSTLKGTTGTAFAISFQNCISQVGGVIGPQLFRDRYAYNGYKTIFAICAGSLGASLLMNLWTWWLTKDVESEVRKVRRERRYAEKGHKENGDKGDVTYNEKV